MATIHHLLVGWTLFVLGQYWVWGLTGPSSCWDFFFLGVDADVALPRVRGGLGTHPLCWLFSFMLWSLFQDAERRAGWSLRMPSASGYSRADSPAQRIGCGDPVEVPLGRKP